MNALVGYTGFIGSNLNEPARFDSRFNSKNIEHIKGREYDLVVCAGAPASKSKANAAPEADRENLERLTRSLAELKAKRVILISTLEVYKNPVGVDEATEPDESGLHAYGRHRLLLERFIRDRFTSTVIRLPSVFGKGLKKNVVFDLMRGHELEKLHADSQFQLYSLDHLWTDLELAIENDIEVINIASEPVPVKDIARVAFGMDFQNRPSGAPIFQDIRTRYANLWGGPPGYQYRKETVLAELSNFLARARKPGKKAA